MSDDDDRFIPIFPNEITLYILSFLNISGDIGIWMKTRAISKHFKELVERDHKKPTYVVARMKYNNLINKWEFFKNERALVSDQNLLYYRISDFISYNAQRFKSQCFYLFFTPSSHELTKQRKIRKQCEYKVIAFLENVMLKKSQKGISNQSLIELYDMFSYSFNLVDRVEHRIKIKKQQRNRIAISKKIKKRSKTHIKFLSDNQ